MWWWVWVLLVLGTLAGAALLARSLWRRGVRLMRALGEAGETLGSVADRATAAAAEAGPPDTSPTIFDDPVVLRERVAAVRRRGADLAARRRERRERVWRRWSDGPSATQQWLAAREREKAGRAGARPRSGA
jgi:hypothetical protein